MPAGSGVLYSTYFGGSGDDAGAAIAIDAASIYVAGATDSTNFPLKANVQGDQPGTDAFVAKFNPVATTGSSSLLYSTYLGGSDTDTASGIAVNGEGAVFVTVRDQAEPQGRRRAVAGLLDVARRSATTRASESRSTRAATPTWSARASPHRMPSS